MWDFDLWCINYSFGPCSLQLVLLEASDLAFELQARVLICLIDNANWWSPRDFRLSLIITKLMILPPSHLPTHETSHKCSPSQLNENSCTPKSPTDRAQWCTVIPATLGAEAGEAQGQSHGHPGQVRSCLKKSWGWNSAVECPWVQSLVPHIKKKGGKKGSY